MKLIVADQYSYVFVFIAIKYVQVTHKRLRLKKEKEIDRTSLYKTLSDPFGGVFYPFLI